MITDRVFNDGDNIANTLDRYAMKGVAPESIRTWIRSTTKSTQEFEIYYNYYQRLTKMLGGQNEKGN